MAIDAEFLAKLRCPQTGTPLRAASSGELERVNAAVRAGRAKNLGGEAVREPLAAGLIPESGEFVYPVQEGIPVLLAEQAIAFEPGDPAETGPPGTVPERSEP